MATILFQAAGAALGSVFGPVGGEAGPRGRRAGGLVDGSLADLGHVNRFRYASFYRAHWRARMRERRFRGFTGTARIGGTLIWATRFEEEMTTERTRRQGNRRHAGGRATTTTPISRLGLCEARSRW